VATLPQVSRRIACVLPMPLLMRGCVHPHPHPHPTPPPHPPPHPALQTPTASLPACTRNCMPPQFMGYISHHSPTTTSLHLLQHLPLCLAPHAQKSPSHRTKVGSAVRTMAAASCKPNWKCGPSKYCSNAFLTCHQAREVRLLFLLLLLFPILSCMLHNPFHLFLPVARSMLHAWGH